MVFDSLLFVVFFAVVLGLHALPIPWLWKKRVLLVESWFFYAAWKPPFVAFLCISTALDWFAANAIANASSKARRDAWLAASMAVNLGLLGFFKYGGFFVENAVALANVLGLGWSTPALEIVLPVGISFYTFQSMSYVIDVWRGTLKPARTFLDFALYVAFFPQLVAGPIVRATEFLPQLEREPRATRAQLGYGAALFVLGIFMKSVLADGVFAKPVEGVFDTRATLEFASAWIGALAFAGQIFCDFAGYSTCAIGAALCLGIQLTPNFRFPYAAIGFSDFWRRWHVSLSTWLRDYLYIPLGGNRRGPLRTNVNLMATMLLGGLWHGASWTFVVWGGLHGAFLVIERRLKELVPLRMETWSAPARLATSLALAWLTFVGVCFAWVFFRSKSFERAGDISAAMLGFGAGGRALVGAAEGGVVVSTTLLILCVHFAMRETKLEALVARTPGWLLAVALAAMVFAIVCVPGEDRAFIYFQF